MQKIITLIDARSRFFLLSVIPHSHNRASLNLGNTLVDKDGSVVPLITFRSPYFVVSLSVLERIWNVDQAQTKIVAQID